MIEPLTYCSLRAMWRSFEMAAVFFLLLRASDAWCAQAKASRPTDHCLEEVMASLRRSDEVITSLSVTIRAESENNAFRPPGHYFRQTIKVQSPVSFLYDASHAHNRLRWQDDPLRQIGIICNGKVQILLPYDRVLKEFAWPDDAGLPGTLQKPAFLVATALWPLTGREPPRVFDRPFMIKEFTKVAGYELSPDQELIGDRWCHVVTKESEDVVWIDVDRGVIVRRDVLAGTPPRLASRYILSEHRRYGDQVWLPDLIANIQVDWQAADPEQRGRRVIDSQIRVIAAEVNRGSSADFAMSLQPGTVRLNLAGGATFEQIVPGGEDHLEHVVSWLTNRRKAGSKAFTSYSDFSIAIASGLLGGALALLRFVPFRRVWKRATRSEA